MPRKRIAIVAPGRLRGKSHGPHAQEAEHPHRHLVDDAAHRHRRQLAACGRWPATVLSVSVTSGTVTLEAIIGRASAQTLRCVGR